VGRTVITRSADLVRQNQRYLVLTGTVVRVTTNRLRLLILIVAYNAESTLSPVLDRLPAAILLDYDCEVLVIDDASEDGTFEDAMRYRRAHVDLPLTVLRNRSNQGYGGNQKVGYTYAIQEGFDIVALVHGDGQYAPEEFASSHSWALDAVPDGARVLDLGADPGGLAAELAKKGCQTAVVDVVAPTQSTPGVAVHVADLNEELDLPIQDYDYYVMLDVIEHLKDPELFLDGLRARLDDAAIGDSRLSRALLWLNQVLIHIRPGLFSYQIFVRATVTPDVATVLASTRASVAVAAA